VMPKLRKYLKFFGLVFAISVALILLSLAIGLLIDPIIGMTVFVVGIHISVFCVANLEHKIGG